MPISLKLLARPMASLTLSRRQWSACVLYVSASSSKRSASIWFMTEVSQRQPLQLLGHGSIPVKGLTDVFGVMMVEIVVVPVAVAIEITGVVVVFVL